jgi:NarL family two-component system response regulator LiaR
MSFIKVFIVDDQDLVREGIRHILGRDKEIEIVGEAAGAREGLKEIDHLRPDIVFMDIRMPGINGIEATRLITERHPDIKVILLTNYDEEIYIVEGLKAGAKAFVLKSVTKSEMLKVTHAVYNGQAVLDPAITSTVISMAMEKLSRSENGQEVADSSQGNLTFRELEILEGMVEGKSNKEIGGDLFIGEPTVKHHVKNIFKKLGVKSRTEAVSKSIKKKIIYLGSPT